MEKTKNQLAQERYHKDYKDLCGIRKSVIDDMYKLMKLNDSRGRCNNCGKYFQVSESIDGGTTCSPICSQQYSTYLNKEKNETK